MLFEHVKEAIEGTFTESRLVWCNVSRVIAFLSVSVEKLGCLPFTKTIRLEISGINIKQLNAKLRE